MRLRSARDGAEHCACQRLRVPCDEVVEAARGTVGRGQFSMCPMK